MYLRISTMKIKLIFLLAIFLLCATCKKKKKEIQYQYPEDPQTTTLTPRERLHASWRVYAYQFNGIDILSKLDTFYGGEFKVEDVAISYDVDSDTKQWFFIISNQYISFKSETAFNVEDPYYITIYSQTNCCRYYLSKWFITPFKYVPNTTVKWSITKLYGNELNLVLKTDSGDYKIFLKKH